MGFFSLYIIIVVIWFPSFSFFTDINFCMQYQETNYISNLLRIVLAHKGFLLPVLPCLHITPHCTSVLLQKVCIFMRTGQVCELLSMNICTQKLIFPSVNVGVPLCSYQEIKKLSLTSLGARIAQSVQWWALAGWLGFDSHQGQEIFLYSTVSILALEPIQPPIQWEPRAHTSGVKQPGREGDHSPPSNAKVKNVGAIPPFPYMSLWHSA
jgi:hypothetical protein